MIDYRKGTEVGDADSLLRLLITRNFKRLRSQVLLSVQNLLGDLNLLPHKHFTTVLPSRHLGILTDFSTLL